MKFIRVLYNENLEQERPKLLKDLGKSLSVKKHADRLRDFIRNEMTYYTMGKEATDLLRDVGMTDVRQVVDKPLLRKGGGVYSWNKLYLLRKALEDHGEILYTDLDVYLTRCFDPDGVTAELRKHAGLGRVLQMPLISYLRSGHFWYRGKTTGEGWDRVSGKIGLFGCFIYCTSVKLIDCFLEDYDEVEKLARKRKHGVGDEHTIIYSLDKRFGRMTLRELYDNFQPAMIRQRCRELGGLVKKIPNPAFRHMR